MKNADMPAMPQARDWQDDMEKHAERPGVCGAPPLTGSGLTKREHFAAMAMTSSSNPYDAHDHKPRAQWALRQADALLEEFGNGEA